MSKARELIEETVESEVTLSSGVTIKILPFPAGLYRKIQKKAMQDHPEPDPPQKTIEVVDGTEEIDDIENEDYQAALAAAQTARNNLLLEAILDLCVEVDMDRWQPVVKRLAHYDVDFPEDPIEQKIEFLNMYALRTRGDYELVTVIATAQTIASDPEVAERIKTFRGQMARTASNGADASSADAE